MSSTRLEAGRVVAVAALFTALAVVHTWPLFSAPGTLCRNDNGDALLNEWIVSWIAHQLPRDPARLFHANIFHPEPRTLAFSEPLLVPALLGAPVRWLGGSPVLTFNLLLLAGFVLTGVAGYVAAERLTGDAWAGALAGSLLAFNAESLTRLPHLQAHHAEWMPLCVLLLDRVLADSASGPGASANSASGPGASARAAVALGVCVALLALTSGYWAALVAVVLGAGTLGRADAVLRAPRPVLGRLALAAAVAGVLAVGPLLPYARVHREQGLTRTLEETAAFASRPSSYLSTPSRLHQATWSARFWGEWGGAYFPGVAALALAAWAVVRAAAADRPRVRMLLAIGAAGLLLSLGPATPAYAWLHAAFPPMKGLRDPSRFGHLVLLAVALLAAFGLAALRRRHPGRRGAVLAALLVAAANAEALVAPIGYVRFEGFSPIYAVMARQEEGAVLAEFPMYGARAVHRNAGYVLASTVHWRRLVNGYSGFTPPAFLARAERLRDFPGGSTLAELRRLGVTHVAVHPGRYREPRASRLRTELARPGLTLLASGPDGESLFRLEPGRTGAGGR